MHAGGRDYEKWDGSIFEFTPPRPGRKKQNPVLPRRTYGLKKTWGVYVLPRRTQLRPGGVPPRLTHLEYHL
jgi:hypothetical protein